MSFSLTIYPVYGIIPGTNELFCIECLCIDSLAIINQFDTLNAFVGGGPIEEQWGLIQTEKLPPGSKAKIPDQKGLQTNDKFGNPLRIVYGKELKKLELRDKDFKVKALLAFIRHQPNNRMFVLLLS